MGFMKQNVLYNMNEVSEAVYNLPSVSIILPFEPKMKSKKELASTLQSAIDEVERKIFNKFSVDMAVLVLQKLKSIVNDLDYNTHKKSLAIYVSPVFEKVLYLNMQVEEKILVSKSFHIHDLIKSKKQLHQYLLLQIEDKECRIYVNESGEMEKIFSYKLENVLNYINDFAARRKINFDTENEKNNTEKFLHRIDNTLNFILESYPLPIFVVGTEIKLKLFNKITTHLPVIIEYLTYNNEDATIDYFFFYIFPLSYMGSY